MQLNQQKRVPTKIEEVVANVGSIHVKRIGP